MRRKYVEYLVVGLFILCAVGQAEAQFYKVYGWKTPEAGEIELVYWTTYIASSDFEYSFFDTVVKREGLVAHSFEVEYGVTDRLTLAAYFDFENPSNADFKYTRFRAVFFRYRFFNKGERFLDPAIYIEYYIPKKEYDSEELEVRLILEKDINNFTLSTNTMFEKKTSGHEVDEGLELNFAAGLYYRKYQAIQPGIEYYGKYGEFSGFEELDEQQHILFPTLDVRFGTGFHWHVGIGFGLTEASDDVTVKSIFSYEF